MADVREIFDTDAAEYRKYKYSSEVSVLDWYSFESRRSRVAQLLEAHAEHALDLGCGSGPYLPLLASRCDELVAMDFSGAMLKEARVACPNVAATYVVGNATAVPLRDNRFDLVNCIGVVEYLQDAATCLNEIHRLLRPGGTAVVSVPNAHSLWRLAERGYGPVARRLRRALGLARPEQAMDSFPRRLYAANELRRLIQSAGLWVETTTYYNYRVPFIGSLSPGSSLALSRWLERVTPDAAGWILGGGIVARATKPRDA